MKFTRIFADSCLHSRLARMAVNATALIIFPKHRKFYIAGIKREFQKPPKSKLGPLLAVHLAKSKTR